MHLAQLATAWAMTMRQLVRMRLALVLLFVIPALFDAIIVLTTSDVETSFRLASIPRQASEEPDEGGPLAAVDLLAPEPEGARVSAPRRSEALVFIGVVAVGLVSAFFALHLIQKSAPVSRRLVLCGYRPTYLLLARLAALLCVVGFVGLYVATLMCWFFRPQHFGATLAGLVLAGWVYGCLGALTGALFRRDLEGILAILLLANIDAGWLQNPLYYGSALHLGVIRSLPAHFPSQVAMVAAFSDHATAPSIAKSVAYGLALLAGAFVVFARRMHVAERRGGEHALTR